MDSNIFWWFSAQQWKKCLLCWAWKTIPSWESCLCPKNIPLLVLYDLEVAEHRHHGDVKVCEGDCDRGVFGSSGLRDELRAFDEMAFRLDDAWVWGTMAIEMTKTCSAIS
ncbi:hypothetical protein VIGAN_07182500 [Vigna angularis var. angularis]|uniref:Uncharacterized protein n=1 Tax=Vigna angularis var. angularis TaxID=157739 RepID=A0A0S3SJF5_PHAAN|nr:hypothetical protein VIGAN_07182500 [Vigna angularis var. angularis]